MRPHLWLWLGDSIYARPGATPEGIAAEYTRARAGADAARFFGSVPLVDGVYDDHDYGANDAGREHAHRDAARRLFLDSIGAPDNSARRSQPDGLYGSRDVGDVRVVMLDARYARELPVVPSVGASRWLPRPGYIAAMVRCVCALLGLGRSHDADVLGEAQWAWLEGALRNSTARAHLVVSSIQVLTSSPLVESWGQFPRARDRLLDLLADARPRGAVLLSGDVHYGELIGLRPEKVAGKWPSGANLLEVTSSGLTHACGEKALGRALCALIHWLFGAHRVADGARTPRINFGTVHVDDEALHFAIRGVDGAPLLEHTLPLGLSPADERRRWIAARDAMPSIIDDGARGGRALGALGGALGTLALCALLGMRALRRRAALARHAAKAHAA